MFTPGEVCIYNFSQFLFSEVKRLAAKNNVIISYCRPGSAEYKMYGGSCFKILDGPNMIREQDDEEPEQMFYFDVNKLVI
jgi:hypothetical protein